MKIAGIVFAVLLLVGSALVGVLGMNKSMDLAQTIDKIAGSLSAAQMAEAGIPSPGRLKAGGIVGIIAALAAFGLIVVTFIKREKIPHVAGAAVALAVVSIFIYPSMKVGPADGMAPKTQAIVATVMALLGAGAAFLVKKKSEA